MKHPVAAVVAAFVVASPAAPGAATYDGPANRGDATESGFSQRDSTAVFVPVDDGFHWGDAAIGAAGAGGIATIGAAGVALRRPRRIGGVE